jgi:hypothetical protein
MGVDAGGNGKGIGASAAAGRGEEAITTAAWTSGIAPVGSGIGGSDAGNRAGEDGTGAGAGVLRNAAFRRTGGLPNERYRIPIVPSAVLSRSTSRSSLINYGTLCCAAEHAATHLETKPEI